MIARTSTSLALAASLFSHVSAHTYMIQPKGRLAFQNGFGDSLEAGSGNWKGLCHIGDGTPTCCNTPQMSDSQMTTYKRGDEIPTAWWRNNHVGGFTRYSIVPVDKSDSQDEFDSAENVRSYGCNQVGCSGTYGGESPNNWNGGDSEGSKTWSNPCTGSFKVPYDLEDGTYTVQWIWFGTGNAPSANSPFQTCVDFKISGGPTGSKPKCPLWKGGDLSEKSDNACVYVSVNNPTYQGTCASANACQGSYQVGVPQAVQDCYSGKSSSTYPLVMVSAPNGFPDTYTSYKASGSAGSSGNSTTSSSSSKGSSSKGTTKKGSTSSSKSKSKKPKTQKNVVDASDSYSLSKSGNHSNPKTSCMKKRSAHGRRAPARLHKAGYSS